MLILTRRVGETVIIGEGENKKTITILGVKGNQVRIGIDAPASEPVHREEIYNKIHGIETEQTTEQTPAKPKVITKHRRTFKPDDADGNK